MIYMGLDIATKTGVAFYDTDKPRSAIEAFTVTLEGDSSEAKAWSLSPKLQKVIKQYGRMPQFAVVEQAPKQVYTGTAIHSTIQLNVLAGAFFAFLGAYSIPGQTVTDSSWRKAMLGMGRQKGWTSKDWKKRAQELCDLENIPCRNADEAEAILLALWGSTNSHLAQKLQLDRAKAS